MRVKEQKEEVGLDYETLRLLLRLPHYNIVRAYNLLIIDRNSSLEDIHGMLHDMSPTKSRIINVIIMGI